MYLCITNQNQLLCMTKKNPFFVDNIQMSCMYNVLYIPQTLCWCVMFDFPWFSYFLVIVRLKIMRITKKHIRLFFLYQNLPWECQGNLTFTRSYAYGVLMLCYLNLKIQFNTNIYRFWFYRFAGRKWFLDDHITRKTVT